MPHPYKGGEVYFARDLTINMPHLGVHIGEVSVAWNLAEEVLAFALAIILRPEGAAGLIIYHALTGSASQRAALNEVADQYLAGDLRDRFKSIIVLMKGRARERNAIIHGLWFIDPKNHPHDLILAPKHPFTGLLRGALPHGGKVGPELACRFPNYEGWLVYREKDFRDVEQRIRSYMGTINAFIHTLLDLLPDAQAHPPTPPPQ